MSQNFRRSPQRPVLLPSSKSPSPARSPSPQIIYEYRKCKICGRDARQECFGCMKTYYCGAECHTSDWTEHRLTCRLMIPSNRRSK